MYHLNHNVSVNLHLLASWKNVYCMHECIYSKNYLQANASSNKACNLHLFWGLSCQRTEQTQMYIEFWQIC